MRFQAIVMSHFLEHVEDQIGLIRTMKQMLAPPGILCIATPNRLSSLMENPYHYHECTHAELEEMLQSEFPRVEMYSLMLSAQFQEYRMLRRQMVRRLYALDPLKLRNRIPRRVHQVLFDLAALIGNRLIARAADRQEYHLTLDDFDIVEGSHAAALNVLAIAQLRA